MKVKKSIKRILIESILLLILTLFMSLPASTVTAKETKLIFASFLPDHDNLAVAFKAYGEEIEKISGGSIKVEFSWGGALGPPPGYYDLVVNNICDVGMVFPSYVKGRFPMSDVVQNAWVFSDPEIATRTYWEFHKRGYFEKEYSDSKLLYVSCGAGDPGLWTAKKRVSEIEHAKGLKIRTTGGQMTERIKALGCIPVSIPITELYQALQKKTIDGLITMWGAMDTWKLYEVIKYSTNPGVGAGPVAVLMNRNTFNKLPTKVKQAIDEMWMTGKYTIMSAKTAVKAVEHGKETFQKNAGEMVEWSPDAIKEIGKLWSPIWQKWITEMEKKGMPGKKIVDEMYFYLKELGVDMPAIGYNPK